ncbi:hypothetical protein IJH16_03445 [Candidatus Saccharibacteria bacterium]|nr:hypothetical protein [Candidatus Saccharibacteria bacterium]
MLSAASPTPPNTRRYPLSYVLSGHYGWNTNSLAGQGANGFFWTIVAYNSTDAYLMDIGDSAIFPQYHYSKAYGFTLRSTNTRRYPLSYVYAGIYYWKDGDLLAQGSYGYGWSTYTADGTANSLVFQGSSLNPQNQSNPNGGFYLC